MKTIGTTLGGGTSSSIKDPECLVRFHGDESSINLLGEGLTNPNIVSISPKPCRVAILMEEE